MGRDSRARVEDDTRADAVVVCVDKNISCVLDLCVCKTWCALQRRQVASWCGCARCTEKAALGGAGYSPSQDSLPYSISGGTVRGYRSWRRPRIDITQCVLRPILRRMGGSCRDRPRALGIGAAAYVVCFCVCSTYMACKWCTTIVPGQRGRRGRGYTAGGRLEGRARRTHVSAAVP